MFINNFDPVAFSLFSLEFRWYSLSYIFGILAGWVLAKRIFIKDDNLKEEAADLIYHLLVLLELCDVDFEDILHILEGRTNQSGLQEKSNRL